MVAAVFKVIASGTTSDQQLRATLMQSPSPASSESCEKLPGILWNSWRKKGGWEIELQVAKIRIGTTCEVSFEAAISRALNVPATALWAGRCWGNTVPGWVNELWRLSFRAFDNKNNVDKVLSPEVWKALHASLLRSNEGDALKAGAMDQAGPQPVQPPSPPPPASNTDNNGKAAITSGMPDNATQTRIHSVIPSQQSDLALLFETERAMELCNSTRWAYGDFATFARVEDACANLVAEKKPGDRQHAIDEAVRQLKEHTQARYGKAKAAVAAQYASCQAGPKPDSKAEATWAVDPGGLGLNREQVAKKIGQAASSYQAAHRSEDSSGLEDKGSANFLERENQAPGKIANQRYYAIQGSPSLSRLFGLTIDLSIKIKDLHKALDLSEPGSPGLPAEAYFLLGVKIDPDQGKTVWTLVKYKPGSSAPHFMPASRCEITTDGIHAEAAQYDGVLVLGQKLEGGVKDGDVKKPTLDRFLLTSLDVPAATQAAIDRMQRGQQAPQSALSNQKDRSVSLARKPTVWARKTHTTAGLVLLDRGRLEQAVGQFGARTAHSEWNKPPTPGAQPRPIVLDATDLTIGYRVDVAVPIKPRRSRKHSQAVTPLPAPTVLWRSLMARQVAHGTSGPHAASVATAIRHLMGSGAAYGSMEWQETLDDAVLGLPSRMVVTNSTNAAAIDADAYVEEMIAIWTGEPLAAHCAGGPAAKAVVTDVGAGEVITLPSREAHPERRPPPLRFGWPYRLGARAVYSGGISLPLASAVQLYERSDPHVNGKLILPARTDGQPCVRRFLRHERVDAPFLLIHGLLALQAQDEMGFEHAAHAIVRSADEDGYRARGAPVRTQRIFLPPSVDLHFAALHGVFDGVRTEHPPQGLPNVRFDAPQGGFPFVTADTIEGLNGESFDGPRAISTRVDRQGDLVYIEAVAPRKVAYFPDPAVDDYIVAIRYAGTDTYLDGKTVVVPVRLANHRHPECRPLVLRIERDNRPTGRGARPTLEQVATVSAGRARPPLVTDGVEVVVMLAPGDDFEIDVWCVPNAKSLAKLFAVIENIGTLAIATACRNPDDCRMPNYALRAALNELLPSPLCKNIANYLDACNGWPTNSDDIGDDGLAGLTAPNSDVLKAIAESIRTALEHRPIDEIAAVQTLRATHATLRPSKLPLLEPPASPLALQLVRNRHTPPAGGAPTPASSNAAMPAPAAVASASSSPQGDTATSQSFSTSRRTEVEYHLAGSLRVDLATTSGVELRASTVFPTTASFDDPRRGRSARDRRMGTWPPTDLPEATADLFGFEVAVDGQVRLPLRQITLLSIEDLAPPVPGPLAMEGDGRWLLPLETLTTGTKESPLGLVKARHVFPDQKARQLNITILARTRHETLMRTAQGEAHKGRWLRAGRMAAPLSDRGAPKATLWLPAGIRPAEPVATTPIPAFVWSRPPENTHGVSRIAVVRIPLSRGWFSSGEGERLGIVVWPPELLQAQSSARKMALPDFSDEDLGPGGRFITRWGSDPIRPVDPSTPEERLPSFLDRSAFRGLDPGSKIGFAAEIAQSVDMPLRIAQETKVGVDQGQPNALSDYDAPVLSVSLVTYVPRFDVEAEQWYVDAAIDHPYEAQPFVRLGLVRYQEHAPRDLQVSYPTIQWVQLLPKRDVSVFFPAPDEAMVVVEGMGAINDHVDPAPTFVGTRVSLQVVREYTSDGGQRCRSLSERSAMELEPYDPHPNPLKPYRGPRKRWVARVDRKALRADLGFESGDELFAYIEEREVYQPATYPNEPVTSKMLGEVNAVESGPRFLACVALWPVKASPKSH